MPKIAFANIAMMDVPWVPALKTAVENGFEAFELNCFYPEYGPELIADETIDQVSEILENIGFDSFSIDNTFEDLIEIKEKVRPQLMFTLDMGHARLQEGAREGIDMLGNSIRHIHLTDNFGEKDDHLPMGDGNYDYSEFAGFLKNFPYVITMEIIHSGAGPEPMLRARNTFLQLIKEYDSD